MSRQPLGSRVLVSAKCMVAGCWQKWAVITLDGPAPGKRCLACWLAYQRRRARAS